ncbi:MAG: hypothetical protein ACPG6B_03240 [Oceanihabitans sp.]
METIKQHNQKVTRFLTLILVISLFIGCSNKTEQLKWRELNIEILNNTLNEHYSLMKNRYEEFNYIILKKQLSEKQKFDSISITKHFKPCLEDSIYNIVFSKKNISFFNKQKNVDIDYTDFIEESETVKKRVTKEDWESETLPFICDLRCYYVSRVLFTKNYKYAIFSKSYLDYNNIFIYIYENGKYIPYKNSCLFITS